MLEPFLTRFEEKRPMFYKEVARTHAEQTDLFEELAIPMLGWAHASVGEGWEDALIDGYCAFVMDVNRSQMKYEKRGHYEYSSYAEVFEKTYNSSDFMNLYHWGVYTTTFSWGHHLRIYDFFKRYFLDVIPSSEPGRLIDLGCGSGIWHLLALRQLPGWSTTAVDISETTIEIARTMWEKMPEGQPEVDHLVGDALEHRLDEPADAGISSFLLEHLETPDKLLENLCANLKPGAYAFVSCALTAAETDHIYEYTKESEPIAMAEEAGFRVVSVFSSAPAMANPEARFLPRSMAMALQKKKGEIW
ncbi:MAG: class I SAM-dependent methyltransferase [Verrucomicrobiota bacterium]